MGKSTLIANWVKHFSAENPEVKVISHFIGSSGRSRDVLVLLRRCITELREEYLDEGISVRFRDRHLQMSVNILFKYSSIHV